MIIHTFLVVKNFDFLSVLGNKSDSCIIIIRSTSNKKKNKTRTDRKYVLGLYNLTWSQSIYGFMLCFIIYLIVSKITLYGHLDDVLFRCSSAKMLAGERTMRVKVKQNGVILNRKRTLTGQDKTDWFPTHDEKFKNAITCNHFRHVEFFVQVLSCCSAPEWCFCSSINWHVDIYSEFNHIYSWTE